MPTQEETELEIAAFMGPHIKRARIALVLIGLLYVYVGYKDYGTVKQWREALAGTEVAGKVDMLFYFVIFTFIAGVANIVLAAIGGKQTTKTMYIAFGIFVIHSAWMLYLVEALLFTNWQWWITAIVLGMGFQAAMKAEKLRRERAHPAV
jgi:hypothetical protein